MTDDEMIRCACGCGLFRKRFVNGRERRYIQHHYMDNPMPAPSMRKRVHMEIRKAAASPAQADPAKMRGALRAAAQAPLRRFQKGYATDPAGPFFPLVEVAMLIQSGALRAKKLPGKYGRGGVAWVAIGTDG